MVEALFRRIPRSLDSTLQPIDTALRKTCYPGVLLAQNLRIPLTRLEGVTQTGKLHVLVAGPDPFAYDLPLRLFSSPPERRALGTAALWRLNSTLEEIQPQFDFIVARVDRISAHLFFPANYLRVPEWIDSGRDLPEDPVSFLRASDSLKRDVRVARQNGLETSFSDRLDDFDEFYHSMYVPFTRARHGTLARLRNEISLRNCFRRGGLFWLISGGERVGGLVFEVQGDTVSTKGYATRDGYAGSTKKGVATALYYRAIAYGIQRGCRQMDLGGCRACLTDGVLHYKRKWDVRVRAKQDNQFYTLIRWAAWNPGVASLLAELPLLHESEGHLTGISAASLGRIGTQADVNKLYRTLYVPGLDEFVIVNTDGWAKEIVPPPPTVLITGTPLPSELVRR